jgi:zinc transporter ZupT
MTTLVIALLAAGLGGVFLAPVLAGRPGLRAHCTSFAAGILLAVILAHVIPETLDADPTYGGAIILVGFIAMMFLQQKVLKADPCCGHEHAKHAGLPSYLALVACSINDGMILSSIPGPEDGLFWAMFGHKLTACFALVLLLRETSAGLSTAMRNLYMILFVSITPAVILLADQLNFLKDYIPYVVGLGAGSLLYVICGGMIPRVEHSAQEGRKWVLAAFLLGAATMITVQLLDPHDHGAHAGHSHK